MKESCCEELATRTGLESCVRVREGFNEALTEVHMDRVLSRETVLQGIILGHSRIKTTQRYSKLSNVKARRDYFRAMDIVMERTSTQSKRLGYVK